MTQDNITSKISYKEFCALMNRYERSKLRHAKKVHENKFKYKRVFDTKGK
jgi:hypothetical protein